MVKSEFSRDSFIFYRSFLECIEEANEDNQLNLYRAIARYALNLEPPKLKGMEKAVWLAIKPQLDANFKKYMNGCKGAVHGIKGGAPKGNKNARKQPQNNPKTTRNDNDNDNDNDNVDSHSDSPPSLNAVKIFFKKYCKADDWENEAVNFYYYFEAYGWRTSDPNFNPDIDDYDKGIAIKNWRAVATTWIKNWSNKKEYRKKVKKTIKIGYGEQE